MPNWGKAKSLPILGGVKTVWRNQKTDIDMNMDIETVGMQIKKEPVVWLIKKYNLMCQLIKGWNISRKTYFLLFTSSLQQ